MAEETLGASGQPEKGTAAATAVCSPPRPTAADVRPPLQEFPVAEAAHGEGSAAQAAVAAAAVVEGPLELACQGVGRGLEGRQKRR